MKDIAEWLASLDLGEYAQRFAENAIDLSDIRDLTENDLEELGVLLGHRRKMLRAIAELQGEAASKPQTSAEPGRDRAERRQLTVMFCDLVGSTELSARLDPEDMGQLVALFHHRIAEVIDGYQGIVARYMGDGVLAYFVIRKRMRTMPSKPCAPASRSSRPCLICRRARRPHCRSGSASQPASCWLATSSAKVTRRSKRWSAKRRTSLPACKCWPSQVLW